MSDRMSELNALMSDIERHISITTELAGRAARLTAFVESITDATGPYPDLNEHRIVADAYAVLRPTQPEER